MKIYPTGVEVVHFVADRETHAFRGCGDSANGKWKDVKWEDFEKQVDIYDIQFAENSYGCHLVVVYKMMPSVFEKKY